MISDDASNNWFSFALYTNTAELLRKHLKRQQGIVITNVPYHVMNNHDNQ